MTTETIDTSKSVERNRPGPTPRPVTTIEAVRELAPTIAARAEEIEQARRLPVDLVAALRDAGCFRMAVPRSHGGDGASLPEYMRLVRELSRVDGSVGWTMMIGSSAPVGLNEPASATSGPPA